MAANPSTSDATPGEKPLWRLALGWLGRIIWSNKFAMLLAIAGIVSLLATMFIVTRRGAVEAEAETVLWLLVLNLALFAVLALVLIYRMVQSWQRRRRGLAGSRLHMRLVVFFSVLVTIPSVLVAAFAATFFYYGVQGWFSDQVRTAVEESLSVAEAYLAEHQQVIRADALAMATDLNRQSLALMGNDPRLNQAVQTQTLIRNLTEAVVFNGSGQVLAKSGLTFAMEFETVPEDALARARLGEVPVLTSDTDDRVRALVRLDRFVDAYLYVGRFIDPAVLAHMQTARDATAGYRALEEQRGNLIAVMTLIFIGASLLLLIVAIGLALKFASWIAMPISQLIQASDRVSGGDFGVRVAEPAHMDEFSILSRTFNRMTEQLEQQRDELIEANRQSVLRRRFTEAVLSGVSAGIVSLDTAGKVRLANRHALHFFAAEEPPLAIDSTLVDYIPGLAPMITRARLKPQRDYEEQIDIPRGSGENATLLTRLTAELQEGVLTGYIVTFDDITDLVSAQRKAAWSDVARRIAHEIKNPLTPIQLAAERLRRRYGKLVPSDDQAFDTCIDTIIRQVGDIGGMVDEFSSFARMPTPKMARDDLVSVVREVVFLQQQAVSKIRIQITESPERLELVMDQRQIAQALTNVIKNAVESVSTLLAGFAESGEPIDSRNLISVEIQQDDSSCWVNIRDQGLGLPDLAKDRLSEPYVTEREGGTGLGLAIVKKIVEDHGGTLRLVDNPTCGAYVTLVLSKSLSESGEGAQEAALEIGHNT
ncbi:MAG: two-component sensor histidine kinase [Alphaproteobacteria bacterium]|nr:two-component sensor histidine kinase [Alphaproteobacteria bacterium]